MNKTIKYIALLLAISLATVGVVYAATTWTQTGSWTLASSSFTVTPSQGTTTADLGTVQSTDIKTITYTITNNGTTPVIVVCSASAVGATATLSKSQTVNISPGASDTIAVTFSGFTASGTFMVNFNTA